VVTTGVVPLLTVLITGVDARAACAVSAYHINVLFVSYETFAVISGAVSPAHKVTEVVVGAEGFVHGNGQETVNSTGAEVEGEDVDALNAISVKKNLPSLELILFITVTPAMAPVVFAVLSYIPKQKLLGSVRFVTVQFI
jgi:hypothetical protein